MPMRASKAAGLNAVVRAAAFAAALAAIGTLAPADALKTSGRWSENLSQPTLGQHAAYAPAHASIQMLVPKRVRLIIGFTQTVLA